MCEQNRRALANIDDVEACSGDVDQRHGHVIRRLTALRRDKLLASVPARSRSSAPRPPLVRLHQPVNPARLRDCDQHEQKRHRRHRRQIIMIAGDHFFPGKPVSLGVVIVSILLITYSGLSTMGFHITGQIPGGLPSFGRPSLSLQHVDGVVELAFACFLMGYIETVSAGRTMAIKNNYTIDPRQELLSLGAANLATAFFSGYIVAGGLSQSTVNEKSGAKSPLSIIICSITLATILLFFTNLLTNLPEVILAAIVLHAVMGLIKIKELKRISQLSKMEFTVAIVALIGVLVFGILKGVILSVILSLVFLIRKTSHPNIAILGKVQNMNSLLSNGSKSELILPSSRSK